MLQDTLLVLALITDAFLACFAYGAEKVRIPVKSALLMGGIGTGVLLVSMLLSAPFRQLLPEKACQTAGSVLLLLIGLLSVCQNSLKAFLSSKQDARKKLRFKWAGISFALTVYLDETQADADRSKTLSVKEAAVLGLVLSLDSLGIGFGSGFTEHHYLYLTLLSLLLHPAAILLSYRLGRKAAGKLPGACSVLGGVMLMGIALARFF